MDSILYYWYTLRACKGAIYSRICLEKHPSRDDSEKHHEIIVELITLVENRHIPYNALAHAVELESEVSYEIA